MELDSLEDIPSQPKLFSRRERLANRDRLNVRCLRRLNPHLEDFTKIGHTGVYRYQDGHEPEPWQRWVSKRVEGQLFVVKTKASSADGHVRCWLSSFTNKLSIQL